MGEKSFLQLVNNCIITFLSDIRYSIKLLSKRHLSKHAKTLHSDGIVIIESYVDMERCDRLKDTIVDLVNGSLEAMGETRVWTRDSHDGSEAYDTGMIDIFNVDDTIPSVKEIWNQKLVIDIINEIESPKKAYSNNMNSYVNRDVSNTRGYHVDNIAKPQYKAFIYLTDVTDESYGPFCYVKRSFTFSIGKYYNLFLNWKKGYPPTDMRIYNQDNELRCLGKKGTLIIANQNGYHRGRPQGKGRERVILVNNIKLVNPR